MKHRSVRPLVSMLLLTVAVVLSLAAVASAKVVGPCTATIADVDANAASTPQTAVEVEKDESITVGASAESKFTGHKVMLEFAGIRWTVDERPDDGKSWSGTVDVAKYAKYGVGLYKVIGESTGTVCTGTAYIKVKGNPLGTVAGAGAVGSAVVGGALMAGSIVRAARRPRKQAEAALQRQKVPGDEGLSPELPSKREGVDYHLPGHEPGWLTRKTPKRWVLGCDEMLPMAFFQTIAFMVAGMGAPGAPAAATRSKVGFRLSISISGVIGAFLAGLGTLVLAQQAGVIYPTATVAIAWLAAWVVAEVVLTSLSSRIGIKKALAMLDAARPESPAPPGAGV